MFDNSAYRKEAWGCCYAGAEGGDLALPLELLLAFASNVIESRPICLLDVY